MLLRFTFIEWFAVGVPNKVAGDIELYCPITFTGQLKELIWKLEPPENDGKIQRKENVEKPWVKSLFWILTFCSSLYNI